MPISAFFSSSAFNISDPDYTKRAQLPLLWINGQWLAGEGEPLQSLNPATAHIIWQGKAASAAQIEAALWAARQALPAWMALTLQERITVLMRFTELLRQHQEALALTITQETGKPLWESRTEVIAMQGKTEIAIRAYLERTGERESALPQGRAMVRHRAHGVMAVFGPYNFPGHLPNGHIIPALLAGNTVVFKPSEQTPLVAAHVAALWQQSGLPAGVLNLVQGARDVGKALAASPELDGLLFTGSSATGLQLARESLAFPQRIVALEMGGNNPLIVQSVSDMRAAVHDIVHSAFLSAGQRCTSARRLLLPQGAEGDQLLAILLRVTEQLEVGMPQSDPQPFIGSMINAEVADQLCHTEQQLLALGARSLLPLRRSALGGAFLHPAIIDVSDVPVLPDEEYFGPLLQVQRYRDFTHALTLANQTRYGLSAGLLSDDAELYQQFYSQIRAGIVNWNRPLTGASSAAPFGGCGASGNHHPSAFYAADYCAYPVASMEQPRVTLPTQLSPGLHL
ncbi:MAG: succinylglutamate-semialdehyde dehydrogenase [Plesiomonas sp.]|uniref:succinylglutamate-semialdehyde dehydrogenase n=1 Tax=Plesiomonas sp. TaxID=2486279 RepID=UPI003EE60DE9